MVAEQFACVLACCLVGMLVGAAVEQQVVAHAAADKTLLDAGQGVYCVVDVEQTAVVGIQVRADARVDARGTAALGAGLAVLAPHAVHVGRRAAKVREVTLEVGHLYHLFHLFQDALFGPTGNELALMGGDGAEGAAAEAATMDVDRELDHLVGRYHLALVLGMRQPGVREVKRGIELFGGHGRIGRVDHGIACAHRLQQPPGVHLVGFFLDVPEVFGLCALAFQTCLMAVEHDVVVGDAAGNLGFGTEVHRLWDVSGLCHAVAGAELATERCDGFLAHAVDDEVGTRRAEYAGHELVLPVVVVGETAHGGLDAAQHHGHIGVQLFEYLGVHDGGIVWAQAVAAVRTVGIVAPHAAVGGVAVDHRVHGSRRDSEKEARPPQFLEVAVVAVPVGLWYNGHSVTLGFQHTAYDGCTKRWVIHIGIAREEDDIQLVPSS